MRFDLHLENRITKIKIASFIKTKLNSNWHCDVRFYEYYEIATFICATHTCGVVLWINRFFDKVCGTLNKYAEQPTYSISHEYRHTAFPCGARGNVCNRLSVDDRRVACTVNERQATVCERHERNTSVSACSQMALDARAIQTRLPFSCATSASAINKTSAAQMIKILEWISIDSVHSLKIAFRSVIYSKMFDSPESGKILLSLYLRFQRVASLYLHASVCFTAS